jgi:hypothetical protein
MKLAKLNEIRERLTGKRWLEVMETNVFNIPERVAEYDPNMFVCYNRALGEYEVHSLRNRDDNTHCLSVPWAELDDRTLKLIAARDLNRRYLKDIVREIDERNAKIETDRDARRRDEWGQVAKDTANMAFRRHYLCKF